MPPKGTELRLVVAGLAIFSGMLIGTIADAEIIRDMTRPMVIELAIVPLSEITAIDASAKALAYPGDPCRIMFPAGRGVRLNPATRRAAWEDRADGDLFAHEIMHCQRGQWHPK